MEKHQLREKRIRRPRGEQKHTCSKCGGNKEPKRMRQRYCGTCHALYMTIWRNKHKAA